MNITEFAKCETMALRSLPARPALPRGGYATPVATYVRHLVFGHLARETIEEPDAMTFDRRTRFAHVAHLQARDMFGACRAKLAERHETIVECSSRADGYFICQCGPHRILILLVTHDRIGNRWLEVARRVAEYNESDPAEGQVTHGGILHVLRRETSATPAVRIQTRPVGGAADGLAHAYDGWRRRISDVVDKGATPRATPGTHCRYCSLKDCPVRNDFDFCQ